MNAALPLDGRAAVVSAWREALVRLPDTPTREVWLIDADFNDWPLDDAAVLQALTQWARPAGRCLRMIALSFDAMTLRLPRFATWRRDWTHRFDAWRPSGGEVTELPSLLLAGNYGIETLDRSQWRARSVSDAAALRTLTERADAILQRCEPDWPATMLGL
jgi:hypothetical protein